MMPSTKYTQTSLASRNLAVSQGHNLAPRQRETIPAEKQSPIFQVGGDSVYETKREMLVDGAARIPVASSLPESPTDVHIQTRNGSWGWKYSGNSGDFCSSDKRKYEYKSCRRRRLRLLHLYSGSSNHLSSRLKPTKSEDEQTLDTCDGGSNNQAEVQFMSR